MCSNASITKILRINDNNLVILSNEKEKIKGIKYLQIKDWKHNVISFSALDHDGHFVDSIIDEKIDLEKIVEVRMQIEELHRALNTLTKEERELMEAIFYKEESLRSISRREKVTHQAISGRRDRILEKLRKILEDKI